MKATRIYIAKGSPALEFAETYLRQRGFAIADSPDERVTHVLLPVPVSGPLPQGIPENAVVFGGRLPETKNRQVDFLQDERYLTKNAAITAECAIRMAGSLLPRVWAGCPVLILGWGRIGKFLSWQLKDLGADVTVAVRKEKDLAIIRAIGFRGEDIESAGSLAPYFRVVFNTVPAPLITAAETAKCRGLLLDLASVPGMAGDAVVAARGLPGKMMPESSGALIGQTVIRHLMKEAAK